MVGEDYLIFHSVTLGGWRVVHGKRYPTVGDHAMIGASAKVLGAIHIGDDAKIRADVMVVENAPSGGIAIGVPAKLRKPKYQVSEDINDISINPSLFI